LSSPGFSTYSNYEILVTDNVNVCGNSLLDGGESCDDGNTDNGDGCDSACLIEPEAVSDGVPISKFPLNGNRDVFSIDLVNGTNYDFALFNAECTRWNGRDMAVMLYDTDRVSLLSSDYENQSGECARVNFTPALSGTYYIEVFGSVGGNGWASSGPNVSSPAGNVYGNYDFIATSSVNSCGNWLLDAGEQCEDGNVANGDGCSSTCFYESTSVTVGSSITGQSVGSNQPDVYTFTAAMSTDYVIEIQNASCSPFDNGDLGLVLLDTDGFTFLSKDYEASTSQCACVTFTAGTNGDYYVYIQGSTNMWSMSGPENLGIIQPAGGNIPSGSYDIAVSLGNSCP